ITRLSLIEVWSGMNSAMRSGTSFLQIEEKIIGIPQYWKNAKTKRQIIIVNVYIFFSNSRNSLLSIPTSL
ncbi:hypothetical protein, partial [Archaeoglobus sp.]|uniref:hypothetical protein n=1 Tax=Archaeoglobus sp. TaxID=1872626 RepID=UPI0024AC2489